LVKHPNPGKNPSIGRISGLFTPKSAWQADRPSPINPASRPLGEAHVMQVGLLGRLAAVLLYSALDWRGAIGVAHQRVANL
jgi:hypothetical protein